MYNSTIYNTINKKICEKDAENAKFIVPMVLDGSSYNINGDSCYNLEINVHNHLNNHEYNTTIKIFAKNGKINKIIVGLDSLKGYKNYDNIPNLYGYISESGTIDEACDYIANVAVELLKTTTTWGKVLNFIKHWLSF